MEYFLKLVVVFGILCTGTLKVVASQTVCSNDDLETEWNHIGKSAADIESWRLCTNEPPKDAKLRPSVGNGHVATVVHSNAVYMNGLYNGNGTESTRARIPAVTSLNVSNINLPIKSKSYCLEMDRGTYVERYTGDHWDIELRIYAHRALSRLLVTELIVRASGNHPRLIIPVHINKGNESEEINFKTGQSSLQDTRYMYGRTKVAETPESGTTPVHVYYSMVPTNIVIKEGVSAIVRHTFLMAVGPDKNNTKSYYERGLAMKDSDRLYTNHTTAWHKIWDDGRVDIYGNTHLSAVTYSSLYYIMSAMPTVKETEWPFVGLSPADLAHNGYNGHIFWDQDTWMFPPILVLNSDLGKTLIDTRIRVLDSAKKYARMSSYEGARFPWEGALSGFDVTPWFSGPLEDHITGDVAMAFRQYIMLTHDTETLLHGNLRDAVFAIADFWISRTVYDSVHDEYNIFGFDVTPSRACAEFEIHISGDVSLAFQQYLSVTKDEISLKEGQLKEAIFALADFWVSRSVYNSTLDNFEIREVMPPDEYHFPVNNSVYTNYIAKKSLRLPAFVCKLIGCEVPAKYERVASKIKILFDENLQYHPEFDGYNETIVVKQADAILLGWPLNMNMSEKIRRNDLEIYANVTPGGPAMSWGMFSIGWLELKESGKANETFYEQLKNRRDPFNIWTENADGSGATNFITGMGGYLHSLIFGYAGVRINEDSLTVDCSPFPDTSSFRLKDVDYIGNSFDVICDQKTIKLRLVSGNGTLHVTLSKTGETILLKVDTPVCLERQKITIVRTDNDRKGDNQSTITVPTPAATKHSLSGTTKSNVSSTHLLIYQTCFYLILITLLHLVC